MVKPVSVAADVWKLMNVRRDRVPLGGLAEHKFPLSDFRFYFSWHLGGSIDSNFNFLVRFGLVLSSWVWALELSLAQGECSRYVWQTRPRYWGHCGWRCHGTNDLAGVKKGQ